MIVPTNQPGRVILYSRTIKLLVFTPASWSATVQLNVVHTSVLPGNFYRPIPVYTWADWYPMWQYSDDRGWWLTRLRLLRRLNWIRFASTGLYPNASPIPVCLVPVPVWAIIHLQISIHIPFRSWVILHRSRTGHNKFGESVCGGDIAIIKNWASWWWFGTCYWNAAELDMVRLEGYHYHQWPVPRDRATY